MNGTRCRVPHVGIIKFHRNVMAGCVIRHLCKSYMGKCSIHVTYTASKLCNWAVVLLPHGAAAHCLATSYDLPLLHMGYRYTIASGNWDVTMKAVYLGSSLQHFASLVLIQFGCYLGHASQ